MNETKLAVAVLLAVFVAALASSCGNEVILDDDPSSRAGVFPRGGDRIVLPIPDDNSLDDDETHSQCEGVVCDDDDACTTDQCDEATGTCLNTPIECDETSECVSGVCVPRDPCEGVSCDDGNACTVDTCNGDGTCSNSPIVGCCVTDAQCDDGDPCTESHCLDFGCHDAEISDCCRDDTDCDDADSCTDDTCAVDDCVFTPIECEAGYSCVDGVCTSTLGALVAWGHCGEGACDVPAPNMDFVAAWGGLRITLGLKADGSLVQWGIVDEVPSPNTDFVAIAASQVHRLALRADGSIVGWGNCYQDQCDVPSPNTGFVALAAGYGSSLGLKADGSIVAWGFNG